MKKISEVLNRRFRQRNRRKALRSTRRLHSEPLEPRILLAADVVASLHNAHMAGDVNQDGRMANSDAINWVQNAFNERFSANANGESSGNGSDTSNRLMTDTNGDGETNTLDLVNLMNWLKAGSAPGDPQVEYTHEVSVNGNVVANNATLAVGDVLVTKVLHQDVRAIPQNRFPDLTAPDLRGLVGSYNDLVYSSNLMLRSDVLVDTSGSNVDVLFGEDYALFNTSQNQANPFPTFEANAVRNVGGVQTDLLSKQEPNGSGIFTVYSAALEILGGNPNAVDDTANVEENSINNVISPLANDKVTSTVTVANEFANGQDNEVLTFVADANDLTSQRVPEEEIIFATTLFNISGVALGGLTVTNTVNGVTTVDDRGTADGSDDVLLFTPSPGFSGAATVDYKINDGVGNFAAAQVKINIGPVNDAPVNSVPGAQTIDEDTPLVFTNGSTISVSDIDAGSADVQVDLSVSDGVLSLSGTSNLSFVSGDGTSSVTAKGSLTNINNALNGLTYDPTLNFNGADTLTITTNDQGNTGDGGPLSDTDVVNITINPINDAPINTVPGDQFTVEDDTLVFSSGTGNPISVSDVDAGGGDIVVDLAIATAAGPNVGTLTIGTPGAATVIGNGTDGVRLTGNLVAVNSALNTLSYFAPLNLIGVVTLDVDTNDSGNTGAGGVKADSDSVKITVEQGVSPRPRRDFGKGPEGSPLTIDVLFNDLPTDGFQTFVESFTNGQFGTVSVDDNGSPNDNTDDKLVFTSNDVEFFGTDSFTYVVNDTSGTTPATVAERTGTVDIEITPVNDAPVPTDDTAPNGVEDNNLTIPFSTLTGNDSVGPPNEVGQKASINDVQMVGGQPGSVSIVGTDVVYTPPANFNGTTAFTYTIVDDGLTDGVADPLTSLTRATVGITITEVNDLPSAGPDSATAVEDTQFNGLVSDLLFNDNVGPTNEGPGAGNQDQTLSITQGTFSTSQGGSVTVGSGGTFTYDPPAEFNGLDTFTYTITDDGTTNGAADPLSVDGLLSITVTEVNDPPVPTADSDIGVKDVQTTYNIANLLLNDSRGAVGDLSEAGQTLTVSLPTTDVPGSSVSIVGGDFVYNPSPGFTGMDVIRYKITDNGTTNGVADPQMANGVLDIEVLDFVPTNFGGDVYLDFDGNGVRGASERGLGKVTVRLVGTDFQNNPVDISTLTNMDGTYLFPLVRPGKYDLIQVQPTGMLDGLESPGSSGNDVFSFDIGLLDGFDSLNNNFGERGLHPTFWAGIYNRDTAGYGLFGHALIAAADNSWILALDSWAGVTNLTTSVNGGTITATATTQSGSVTRSFTNDTRIHRATNSQTGESVFRFEGSFDSFFTTMNGESMNGESDVESLDDIANEYSEDTCPEDAVFAAEAWA